MPSKRSQVEMLGTGSVTVVVVTEFPVEQTSVEVTLESCAADTRIPGVLPGRGERAPVRRGGQDGLAAGGTVNKSVTRRRTDGSRIRL
jgi:hypothetical protein